jgi:hypothetical protein
MIYLFGAVKSRMMIWAGRVARVGEMGNVYKIFVGKPERKRQLGRPSRRWEDNFGMDLGKHGRKV